MYEFYLGGVQLPVPPSKVKMDINGNNKTVTLINEGEVNLIKTMGLTEISFDCMIPVITKYPFAYYPKKFTSAEKYLNHFEKLKNSKKPFKFRIGRKTPTNKKIFDTNMDVTLENYKIVEDSKNGFDLIITLELKQYREYSAKKAKIVKDKKTGKDKGTVTPPRKGKDTVKTYTVKKGDTLGIIAKQQLKSTSKWRDIYNLNKSLIESVAKKHGKKSSSSGWWIWEGTVLKLPKG